MDIETVVSDVLARQVALWMLVDCIRRMEWVLVWDVGGLVTQRLFARSEVKFSWIFPFGTVNIITRYVI